jgi:hypothetical protein
MVKYRERRFITWFRQLQEEAKKAFVFRVQTHTSGLNRGIIETRGREVCIVKQSQPQ